MQYMLMIHLNDETIQSIDAELGQEIMTAHLALQKELTESGELVDTHELRPEGSLVVRRGPSGALVTDGPFTEAKEWIAGYYIVETASPERAAEIAAKLVEARFSPVEVRVMR